MTHLPAVRRLALLAAGACAFCALVLLNAHELERELVRDTLNVLLKFEVDVERADRELPALLAHARREGGAAAAPRLA